VRYVVRNLATPGPGTPHQWYESPLACSGTDCGLWRLRFRAADRATFVDDTGFFAWLDGNVTSDGAPEFAGGDFTDLLWDLGSSFNDHGGTVQPFTHIVSTSIREDGTVASPAWSTSTLADGRYVVTVEAWDGAGNRGGESIVLTVNNDGSLTPPTTPTKGWAEVIVRDHGDDMGQIPSNLGGEPFWVSDDILVLTPGQTPSCITQGRGSPVVVGEAYDVYVRAHNIGCQDMPNVRACTPRRPAR